MELHNSVYPALAPEPGIHAVARADRWSDWVLGHVDRHRRWLFLSLLLLYLIGFNAQWRVERDSALYLTISRNLAEGHGYTFRDKPHRLAFPGLPLLFAGTFRIFHTQSLVPLLVLMLLMGLTTLGLTYRLFVLYAGRPTAVVITVGLGMTRLFYRYSFELLSDLPFLLGVMAFLAGYEAIFHRSSHSSPLRGDEKNSSATAFDWTLLVGGLLIAVAVRPAMVALLAAIVLALLWRAIWGQSTLLEIGGLLTIIVVTALAFYHYDPRRYGTSGEGEYELFILKKLSHPFESLGEFRDNLMELFPRGALIKSMFGCSLPVPINVSMGIVAIALMFSLFRYRALWGLFAVFTLGMVLLSKQPVDRYFLPVIPLIIYAWWRWQIWLNHRLPLHWGNLIFLFLFLCGLGTNISRIGEIVVEQRRMPFLAFYHDGRYESAHKVAKLIKNNTFPGDSIVAEPKVGRVMTFLAHRNVFESPDVRELGPHHVYALVGPSWEESKEGRAKNHDPVREWVARTGLRLGPLIGQVKKGPNETDAWALYPVLRQ